jgi:hypothetical protein
MLFVLIHSPLVGPSTWLPVARELERRESRALVPSLLPAATAPVPQWRECVEIGRAATSGVADPIVLVGHSGDGLLLPAIDEARDRGWRVEEISGAQHLHAVVDPLAVTDALLRLAHIGDGAGAQSESTASL